MIRKSLVVLVAVACLALLPSTVSAEDLIPVEDLILESVTLLPKRCDTLHHVQTCDNYHVVGTGGGGFSNPVLEAGRSIVLDDRQFTITSVTDGYWLDDGSVVERSESGSWVEITPNAGHVFAAANWSDDGNGEIGVADSIDLDGQVAKIIDVRYLVRVRASAQ